MSTSIINPSDINIYGINSFINKSITDTKLDIINLEQIKNNFEIDYKFDSKVNQIEEAPLPAFTQLTYNFRVQGEESYDISYNRPPIGPIENFCYCSFCRKTGPEYHSEDCPQPEKKSLYLTLKGVFYYIVQNLTYTGNYIDLKNSIINKTLTQLELNTILLLPNSSKVTATKTIEYSDSIITKISYLQAVKTRGPTKLEYTTATKKFGNAIMLSYEYTVNEEIKKTSIRIYNNGLINFISIPANIDTRKLLYKILIDRINIIPNSINLQNFSTLADKEVIKYEIIPELSYIHSLNSQFNMWIEKEKYSTNFMLLNEIISPFNARGKIVSGEFTTVIDTPQKQIIKLNYDKYSVNIVNWEFSTGKQTKTQALIRELIHCTILPIEGIKMSLQIHKSGTFQMSMSYCNVQDLKSNICSRIINTSENPLSYKYFDIVKDIFVKIFENKPKLVSLSLTYSPESTTLIKNTVSGSAPGNKPGTSTAICRNADPRPGFPSPRPIPYSFTGTCPEPSRQIMEPKGILGSDGLYYPCCSAKTKANQEEYKKYLKEGLPKDSEQAVELGLQNIPYDSKSGILIPGSTNTGAITKTLIDGQWKNIRIMGQKGNSKKPQEFLVQLVENNEIIVVNRKNLLRDSRYFPGLRQFSKDQLIECIIKNTKFKRHHMNIYELENLTSLKSLIDIPDTTFNPILTVYGLNLFEKMKYYVTTVPNTSENYYLVINTGTIYLINIYGNIKYLNLTLMQQISDIIIFNGFFEVNTEKYYITDILYLNKKIEEPFNKKIQILTELFETYFMIETNIVFLEYSENIIKGSKEFLEENNQTLLIFTPNLNYLNFKIWNTEFNKIEPEIILQIIKKNKTNYYEIGYEYKAILQQIVEFNNIFIQKIFIDDNNVKINDYILFKFERNIATGDLASRFLTPLDKTMKPNITYNETLMKISLILNPIQESFFMNNTYQDRYIWSVPKSDTILTYVNDTLPLQQLTI